MRGDLQKKLVVGLGNPGLEYAQTRHNVGFMVVDQLHQKLGLPNWEIAKKLHSEFSKNERYFLMKPTTFMNESGIAVRAVIEYYGDQLGFSAAAGTTTAGFEQVVVIHDDLDLTFGTYKVQFGTGPKIHNGLLSLYEQLGTSLFWHIRVGVDNRAGSRDVPGSNYVLQTFASSELQQLQPVFKAVVEQIMALK